MTQRSRVSLTLGLLGLGAGIASADAQQGNVVPSAPAELQNRRTNIVLRLSAGGVPSINDQPVPWNRLNAELKAIFEHRPEKVLFIEATPSNRVEDVQRVAAVARKQGVTLYAVLDSIRTKG